MTRIIFRRQQLLGRRGSVNPSCLPRHNKLGMVFLKLDQGTQRLVTDLRDATQFPSKDVHFPGFIAAEWTAVDLDRPNQSGA